MNVFLHTCVLQAIADDAETKFVIATHRGLFNIELANTTQRKSENKNKSQTI